MAHLNIPPRRTRSSDGQVHDAGTAAAARSQRPVGPLGRLGRWAATHRRTVALTWVAIAVSLGVLAPRAEHALSGGGWQADGSESVQARRLIDRHFDGQGSYALLAVISSRAHDSSSPAFRATIGRVVRLLRQDPAVGAVPSPEVGGPDGRVAVVRGGAAADTAAMVRAAGRLRERLEAAAGPAIEVSLTGSAALWSEFNEENKAAMMRSEVLSWPVTMAVLAVAFGSLAAAGIPLVLAILGLVATAGALWIGAQLTGITIWAMNFALMFALAVGIDYALFVVVRFRAALRAGLQSEDAVAETMDSAGRAVLVSGVAVLAALAAVMVVPSQPFRTSALGIVLAVGFVLAASLTLLPALLARLGRGIDRFPLPWAGSVDHRSEAFARWGRLIWRRPVLTGGLALTVLLALAFTALGLRTSMPTTGVLPADASARAGSERLQEAFGAGAPAELQVVAPARDSAQLHSALRDTPGVAAATPAQRRDGLALTRVLPVSGGSDFVATVRSRLPHGALVGGAPAEAHDLEQALDRRLPLVYGLVVAVGFALLVLIIRAPLAAAVAVLMNVLATAAAFGTAKLIFQDGHGEGLLGFSSQGFVDAWAPIFFFALIFALAMDYSVFLLSSIRTELDRTGDPRSGLVEGLAGSGRVINAAGAVMVVVFFTFALSGPLAPKEMGVILGVAVLLDTLLVRLLLLPAALRLLGRAAWWTPRMLDRLPQGLRLRHA
jgi:RND superfamily putative drug exporter